MFHVGGTMDIVTAPGQGTTITLTVPLNISNKEESTGNHGNQDSTG